MSTETGTCVIVDGAVVAWFAVFNDTAEEWCIENHFGRWLTWRSTAPAPIPLTPAEKAECERIGREMAAKLRENESGRAGG